MGMLEISNLFAGYDKDNYILKGVNFHLDFNEKVSIFGENGVGKSTLVKVLMGLISNFTGQLKFEGKSIAGKTPIQLRDMGIGYFMQGGRIFSHLTAFENLKAATSGLSLKLASQQIEKTRSEFTLFSNGNLGSIQGSFLSGGERHQLALAMVYAANPYMKLLIADEPSAGLSRVNSEFISNKLRQSNIGILLIEQNQRFAFEVTQRQLIVENGIVK